MEEVKLKQQRIQIQTLLPKKKKNNNNNNIKSFP